MRFKDSKVMKDSLNIDITQKIQFNFQNVITFLITVSLNRSLANENRRLRLPAEV